MTGGPARGPWANTGMARARLAGLSFGAGTPATSSAWQVGAGSATWSGTAHHSTPSLSLLSGVEPARCPACTMKLSLHAAQPQ